MRQLRILLSISTLAIVPVASAQDADELSKQLANPIASLITVPFQSNSTLAPGRTTTALPIR